MLNREVTTGSTWTGCEAKIKAEKRASSFWFLPGSRPRGLRLWRRRKKIKEQQKWRNTFTIFKFRAGGILCPRVWTVKLQSVMTKISKRHLNPKWKCCQRPVWFVTRWRGKVWSPEVVLKRDMWCSSEIDAVHTQNIGAGEAATRSLFFAIAGKSSNTKSSEMAGRKGMVDVIAIWKIETLEITILQISCKSWSILTVIASDRELQIVNVHGSVCSSSGSVLLWHCSPSTLVLFQVIWN